MPTGRCPPLPPFLPAFPPPLPCSLTATTRTFLLATTSSCKRTRRRVSGRSLRLKTPSPSWCLSPTALESRRVFRAAAGLRELSCWVPSCTGLFVFWGTVLHLVRLVSATGWGYDGCIRHRHQICSVVYSFDSLCYPLPPSRHGVAHRTATGVSEHRHGSTDVLMGTRAHRLHRDAYTTSSTSRQKHSPRHKATTHFVPSSPKNHAHQLRLLH